MSNALIEQAIIDLVATFPEQPRFLVAFSGGMDSTVLLDALSQKIPSERLHAVYIDHGLQADSTQWAQHCAQICDHYSIAFQAVAVQVDSSARQGIEAVARQKRYQALCAFVDDQTVLLTAHHQRDQAETLLLNLARGAGVAGLAAMPNLKYWQFDGDQKKRHYRPLLQVPYADLKAYAKHYQLQWVEDSTNVDTNFRRNFIRHEILPKFNQAWPFFEANVAQSALHMSEGLSLLNELAEIDFQRCEHSAFAIKLPEDLFNHFARIKNVIRFWVFHYDMKLQLNQSILEWIESAFKGSTPQSQPQRRLANGLLRTYQTTLFYYRTFQTDYYLDADLFSPNDLQFWNQALMDDFRVLDQLFVGRCVLLRAISAKDMDWVSTPKKLKQWFKQHRVPVWDRQRWPIVEVDHMPVAVLGFHSVKTFVGKELPKG
ncbi:tRNA lysidine(34) synthetase TilS [Hydrogenovibrio sp. SC-1]|uniref:tRNA lysidine(34) synthetase TilS n=1 Tax=Hydrogenovibrio sp. SC-1 TaxID=2065820 RepID=UPI000C7E13D7|nr:tRNA lysidine(34) synthetase TilS [Hydrogenovibrio sp. SC-1]PLA73522.1 tRNA lysidine(34) synthetase TilS [Hydrogenovibrio sp. SC-1]